MGERIAVVAAGFPASLVVEAAHRRAVEPGVNQHRRAGIRGVDVLPGFETTFGVEEFRPAIQQIVFKPHRTPRDYGKGGEHKLVNGEVQR